MNHSAPGADAVHKVLIVKLSSLGDVVHAMPAVQDVLRQCPGVLVDWVVERAFASLVQRCDGVHRVIASDLRRWRHAPLAGATRAAWRNFRADLQQDTYDHVLDLQGLTKSALVARMARCTPGGLRYAMAHATDGSSWEAPTRWLSDRALTLPRHVHAVSRSRLLCAAALGYEVPSVLAYGLLAQTQPAMNASKWIASGTRGAIALVHASSRADKGWPLQLWRGLAQRLIAQGWSLLLPHASVSELEQAQAIARDYPQACVLPLLDLGSMVDVLAGCAGVIGLDSGLSHIAVALDRPHVQLYNFDTAWRTGPLAEQAARQRSVVGSPFPTLDAVWDAWLTVGPRAP